MARPPRSREIEMRDLAILTFVTLDGVMQGPSSPDEDLSEGFVQGGWARDCWEDVMAQVMQKTVFDFQPGRKHL